MLKGLMTMMVEDEVKAIFQLNCLKLLMLNTDDKYIYIFALQLDCVGFAFSWYTRSGDFFLINLFAAPIHCAFRDLKDCSSRQGFLWASYQSL
jgi:hypothetical protein